MRLLLLLSFISGCATSPKIEKIKNEDFKLVTKFTYDANEEGHPSKKNDHFLASESLALMGRQSLNLMSDKEGSVSQITKYCHLERFSAANKVSNDLFREKKTSPIYWNQLGVCSYLKGDLYQAKVFFDLSREAYKMATKSDREYVPAYHNLGLILLHDGRLESAFEIIQKSYELAKQSLTPAFNLAQLYLNNGSYLNARKILISLESKSSQDKEILGMLAQTFFYDNAFDKALNYYQQMKKSDLLDPRWGISYAYALFLNNQIQAAQEHFERMTSSPTSFQEFSVNVGALIKNALKKSNTTKSAAR